MEREPEENYHTEYGKQCIHALSYLLCAHLHCSGIARFCSHLLAGIGEFLSVDDENYQRKNHSQDSYTECIMETSGKHVQIFIGKYRHIRYGCSGNSGFRCQCTISVHSFGSQRSCQMSVAKGRQVGIIIVAECGQPPVTYAYCGKRSKDGTYRIRRNRNHACWNIGDCRTSALPALEDFP